MPFQAAALLFAPRLPPRTILSFGAGTFLAAMGWLALSGDGFMVVERVGLLLGGFCGRKTAPERRFSQMTTVSQSGSPGGQPKPTTRRHPSSQPQHPVHKLLRGLLDAPLTERVPCKERVYAARSSATKAIFTMPEVSPFANSPDTNREPKCRPRQFLSAVAIPKNEGVG